MTESYKYICEKCNYNCNIISMWQKHINTELHITGVKKIRSDYKGDKKCNKCDYIGKTINNHSTLDEREKDFNYYCKLCDYGTLSKDLINKHKRFELYLIK